MYVVITCSFYIKCTPANDRKVCTKMLAIHTQRHALTHQKKKLSPHSRTHTHTHTNPQDTGKNNFIAFCIIFFIQTHLLCNATLPVSNGKLKQNSISATKKKIRKNQKNELPKSVKIYCNVNVYVYRNLWTLLYFYINNKQVFSTNLLSEKKN